MDLSLQPRETEAEINELDLIKPKSFCLEKETINKVKREPTEWVKIFANDLSDKALIPNIYMKSSYNSMSKKVNNPVKKWAENLNRHCSKEDIQMANRHMKR